MVKSFFVGPALTLRVASGLHLPDCLQYLVPLASVQLRRFHGFRHAANGICILIDLLLEPSVWPLVQDTRPSTLRSACALARLGLLEYAFRNWRSMSCSFLALMTLDDVGAPATSCGNCPAPARAQPAHPKAAAELTVQHAAAPVSAFAAVAAPAAARAQAAVDTWTRARCLEVADAHSHEDVDLASVGLLEEVDICLRPERSFFCLAYFPRQEAKLGSKKTSSVSRFKSSGRLPGSLFPLRKVRADALLDQLLGQRTRMRAKDAHVPVLAHGQRRRQLVHRRAGAHTGVPRCWLDEALLIHLRGGRCWFIFAAPLLIRLRGSAMPFSSLDRSRLAQLETPLALVTFSGCALGKESRS